MKSLLNIAVLILLGAISGNVMADQFTLSHAPLIVDSEASHELILAGGGATHFSCETGGRNLRSYHGLYCLMHEFLDSWRFTSMISGHAVSDPIETRVWPDRFEKRFPDHSVEEVFLPRELSGLLITWTPPATGPALFSPRVDMRHIWEVPKPEYTTNYNERLGVLFIERVGFEPPTGVPRVIALLPSENGEWREDGRFETTSYPRDAARMAMGETHPWLPASFNFEGDPDWPLKIAVGLGGDEREAFAVARDLLDREEHLRTISGEHRSALAATVPVTSDERVNGALTWARWSLDNLTMNARGPGIYAGYHWFSNYWGRDSFISLPGACLVNGNYGLARRILLSFAEFQLDDSAHHRYGRLPNIVNPDNLQYAGVDGTWWWVRAARLYVDATGDRDFLAKARPVVERAIAGALQHRVDDLGLLTHGDGETWMDAGGEHNPYSPRGDRAIEVQVLWRDALRTASRMADWLGDATAAERHATMAERVHDSILAQFPRRDEHGLADHLDTTDRQDLQIRPNQVFALTLPRLLDETDGPAAWWGESLSRRILDTTMDRVVLPHGVTSLDPADPAWHPRHLALESYYYDETYHNGDVWLWLSGPVIQALCQADRADEAWTMLEPLTQDLLDRGAVGTMREIRDGAATDLQDYGGATSQAWSLAEYLRVFNEAFMGYHPQALDRRIFWRPRLPEALNTLSCQVSFGGYHWRIEIEDDGAVWRRESRTDMEGAQAEWTIHLLREDGSVERRSVIPRDTESITWMEIKGAQR
ncbi:MAG: hypothetical protein GY835_12255 [bacterium]|nr:hypothetical protein [bacterium]